MLLNTVIENSRILEITLTLNGGLTTEFENDENK